jgi:3'(2'), 5'-bisphosphate nucleotidase
MEAVMEIYDSHEGIDFRRKEDGSPLSNADLLANEILCKGLETLTSDIPIISEELENPPFEERRKMRRLWMIDPIDGTYGFIKKNGDFTINIALIEDQQPVLGVIGRPVNGEVYYATAGNGAFVEDGKDKKALSALVFRKKDPRLKFVCSPTQDFSGLQSYFDKFDQPQMYYRGGTIKFLMVAAGEAHLYPSNRRINEWDTAAGQILVEEAGGLVLRADNDQPLKYNKTDLKNPPFIVYGDIQDF